ncbi:hypothetical protein EQN67_23355, partial [Salmonella enterica subsp. enterica serovar Livingstone]|nr:hypothetical protein [Salmonella enterica subsp. enterica serovar Livingstone]ECA8425326.1 hypothetical protein [Salmonella enterica subsp. enterica serovar Livingstone]ECY6429012.1 hypothetical protein [Salmonella enterica subsp. enterica serovar Livingstone]
LVAVRVDRQGQGLLALECGELLGRQQVVVEVAELPRALDPDVAGAQGVLGVVSENGIYGHSRFCNTDFDDKLACLNLSGV